MSRESVERAGLRYPPGNPDDFSTASHRLARASADLQAVPGRVRHLARLGESWTGVAAEWFRAGAARSAANISDVSGALRLASLAADAAGDALRHQQRAARRLADEVNDAEEKYRAAEREAEQAEREAQQARDRAAKAALAAGSLVSGDAFSLAAQARAMREAEVANRRATEARERADRAREHYQDTRQRATRELNRLEEETERADARARRMLEDVTRTLSTVADPSGDLGDCPIDGPLFGGGVGLLPFLTHGRQLARNALRNPLEPLANSARGKAYESMANGLRDTFPGTCVGPEPPTPPKDPPSARPAPVKPEPVDEPNWLERRWQDARHVAGDVGNAAGDAAKDAAGDVGNAAKDGLDAANRWTDQAWWDTEDWLEDNGPGDPFSEGEPGPPPSLDPRRLLRP